MLGVALVSGFWGWSAAGAQTPTPAPNAPTAPTAPTPVDESTWAATRRTIEQSVEQVARYELWTDAAHWRAVVAPYTRHFRYSAEHREVYAVALERQRDDDWLAGFSLFRNSFGQPSAYGYLGRRFYGMFDEPQLFAQVSGGVLYGYRGPFKNKVALNFHGFAPGALVSMGWRTRSGFSTTVHLLGDAAVMLQFAYELR